MRQQDKMILWPAYFDAAKTRGEGRRVPQNLAVTFPKVTEMKEAAEKLGLMCELVLEAGYPSTPWVKTGLLLVEKKESKEQIIKKMAKQLARSRSTPAQK